MYKNLYLYSTSHCHLCEIALDLVLQHVMADGLTVIEITDDEHLLALYGIKIPVLQRQDTLAELNWPFSKEDIANFLK